MAFYSETNNYYNALDPSFGKAQAATMFANYYLGASTSIQPLQAMKDVLGLPVSGIENVELAVIDPQQWGILPKQAFEEMRRLGQINVRGFVEKGKPSPISVHAPLVEPTGFAENRWSEQAWKEAQNLIADAVEKAAVMGPRTPLTIHGSNFPSQLTRRDKAAAEERLKLIREFEKSPYFSPIERKDLAEQHAAIIKQLQTGEVPEVIYAVEPVSGQVLPLREEKKILPGNVVHWYSPQEKLKDYNEIYWGDNLQKPILEYKKAIMEAQAKAAHAPPEEQRKWLEIIRNYEIDMRRHALSVFNIIAHADPNFFNNPAVKAEVDKINRLPATVRPDAIADFLLRIGLPQRVTDVQIGGIEVPPPRIFRPVEDFGREKAAEVFANAAIYSAKIGAKEFNDVSKGPIISIENVAPWAAFGRGETMRELIKAAREKFVEKAKTELKIPEQKAKALAEQIIGTTWDVGHMNLLRRFGYDEKAMLKEVEKIQKDIKHIHLTDNFGHSDSHLAPGMGNVPITEFMKQLEKEGHLKGVRSIIEAGAYVAEWKESPTLKNLQYFNTPVYGFQKAPTWGESIGSYFIGSGGYSAGYGTILPPWHFAEYGTGFAGLPTALGASFPGQKTAE
ncbi:MAG: TIM barrel protein, partial [Candidatus Nanoarchaeia archaeon]